MGLKIEEWHLYPILRYIDDLFLKELITEFQALDLKRTVMALEKDSLSETSILHVINNLRKFKKPKQFLNHQAYKNLIDEEIVSGIINKFRVLCAELMNSQK